MSNLFIENQLTKQQLEEKLDEWYDTTRDNCTWENTNQNNSYYLETNYQPTTQVYPAPVPTAATNWKYTRMGPKETSKIQTT